MENCCVNLLGCRWLFAYSRLRRSNSCLLSPILGALLTLQLFAVTTLAQSAYDISIAPAFGRIYPAGRWIPIRLELRNNSDSPVDGVVRVPVVSLGVATDLRVPVSAPPKSKVALNVFGYLPEKPIGQATADQGTGAVPVAIAEWLGSDGARLARAELLGQPDSINNDTTADSKGVAGYLLLSVANKDTAESRDAYRVQKLAEFLTKHSTVPLNTGESDPTSLPRHVAGYGAVRAAIFNGVSPDVLDTAQRDALTAYLLGGGIVVLPAPLDDANPTGTWIAPWLPVDVIGEREGSDILPTKLDAMVNAGSSANTPVKFLEALSQCEAVDAGGEVALADAYYIHASIKRVGLGRVVFTSFPINALDQSDPRTVALWRKLLDLDRVSYDWTGSALSGERDHVLETMIGAPVAPWSRAAMIAGGYVALMLLIQLVLPGPRRPVAFAAGSGAAVITCVVLLALTATRKADDNSFSAAQLTTIDLGANGGGIRREAMAFFGRDDSGFTITSSDVDLLRPVAASADSPATLTQLPFVAPGAGVRSGRVDRIWESAASVPVDHAVECSLQFTTAGVKLDIDNRLDDEILAPVILWNRQCYPLTNLRRGKSSILLGPKNAAGDFTNSSVFTGEEAAFRGRIVRATVMPPTEGALPASADREPAIVGWIDSKSKFAQPITTFSSQPNSLRSQVMVRTPLTIIASATGDTLDIAPDFVRLTGDSGKGVFYDEAKGEWLQTLQTGNWLIGFQAPQQIGRTQPSRATLRVDLAAPGHKLTFRRGQCVDGFPKETADGPMVAEWNQAVGAREVSVDLEPADADANGCVWLRLSVEEATGASNAGMLPQWKFNRLSVGLTARVETQK